MQQDYKSKLNELTHSYSIAHPTYEIYNMQGVTHNPIFNIKCKCFTLSTISDDCSTKKMAEQNAAKKMINLIEQVITNGELKVAIMEEKELDTCIPLLNACNISKQSSVIVFIDGDNAPNTAEWIVNNRPLWIFYVFIAASASNLQFNYPIKRSFSNLPDATDIRMMLYIDRYKDIADPDHKIIIVSADKIFATFVAEVNDNRIQLARNINDLLQIE